MRAEDADREAAQLWDEIPAFQKERAEDPPRTRYRFVLPNDGDAFPPLVEYFQEVAKGVGLTDEMDLLRLGAALTEALSNSLYHGNLEVSSDLRATDAQQYFDLAQQRAREAPYRNRRLVLEAEAGPERIVLVVRDEGPGFDPTSLPDPTAPENLLSNSGRGVFLMRNFVDIVSYNERGNEVTLVKNVASAGA
ncbi:MAG: ATP-binding protein [Gemmatimonadetes bacterium]|nr:ATP-binding protein [Gemmatimonadota bacterium]